MNFTVEAVQRFSRSPRFITCSRSCVSHGVCFPEPFQFILAQAAFSSIPLNSGSFPDTDQEVGNSQLHRSHFVLLMKTVLNVNRLKIQQ